MGVASRHSTQKRVALAIARLADGDQRTFLFINVAALHTPNRAYLPGCRADNMDSHAAALRYVDSALAPLFAACAARTDVCHRLLGSRQRVAKTATGAIEWPMTACGTCRMRTSIAPDTDTPPKESPP